MNIKPIVSHSSTVLTGGLGDFPKVGARVGIPEVRDWKKGFIGEEMGTSSLQRQTEKRPLHSRERTLLSGPGRVEDSCGLLSMEHGDRAHRVEENRS